LAWTLALATAAAPLGACAAPPAGAGEGGPPPIPASGRCQPYDDQWAYDRVRPQAAELAAAVARAEADHAEVRRKAGLEPRTPGGDHIRIFTWGSFLPGRYSLSAIRMASGEWEVVKVSEGREGGRLPAEPASVKTGRVTGEAAGRLASLVEDRCLYREPTYYGRSVPTPDGGEAACADGSDQLVEIQVAGRRHVSFHACHGFGRAGEVSNILWGAVSGN